jgi:hypothetical protein
MSSPWRWPLRVVIGLSLVGAVAWGGATRPPATAVLAILGALALALTLIAAARNERTVAAAPMALPIAVMAIAATLQLVPLPPSLLAMLSPTAARIGDDALRGIGDPNAWRPLTYDVAATIEQCARLCGLAALAIAFGMLSGERDRRWLRGGLGAALGLALAVPALATVGVVLPPPLLPLTQIRGPVPFSFANPNHAASFFALLLPSVIAMAAREEGRARAALVALALAGNVGLAATLSRGGIAVGIAAQLFILWRAARRGEGERSNKLTVAIAAGAIALAAVPLVARWKDPHSLLASARFRAWHDALPMLRDHLFVGAGRGAFVFAFPRYNSVAGDHRFAFVENEYLQILLDFGVLAGVAIVGAGIVALRRAQQALANEESPSLARAAALTGIAAMALHNALDFSWESGAVAAAACALSALALPAAGRPLKPVVGWILVAATLVASTFALATTRGRPAETDVELLRAARRDKRPAAELDALEEAAWRRHPADSLIADLAAQRRLALGDGSASEWLGRALLVGPHDVAAHHLAARALAHVGDLDLAAIQLRSAISDAGSLDRGPLLATAVTIFTREEDADRLLAAIPPQPLILRAVQTMLVDRRRWQLAERVGAEAVKLAPDDPIVARGRVASGAALGLPDVGERAQHLVSVDPSEANVVAAASALAKSDPRTAERLLSDLFARSPNATVALQLASLLSARGDHPGAITVVERGIAQAIERGDKSRLHRALADLEDKIGNAHRAQAERAEADRLSH